MRRPRLQGWGEVEEPFAVRPDRAPEFGDQLLAVTRMQSVREDDVLGRTVFLEPPHPARRRHQRIQYHPAQGPVIGMDFDTDFGVNRGPMEEARGNFLRGSHS
jgi:hypothetical protein